MGNIILLIIQSRQYIISLQYVNLPKNSVENNLKILIYLKSDSIMSVNLNTILVILLREN